LLREIEQLSAENGITFNLAHMEKAFAPRVRDVASLASYGATQSHRASDPIVALKSFVGRLSTDSITRQSWKQGSFKIDSMTQRSCGEQLARNLGLDPDRVLGAMSLVNSDAFPSLLQNFIAFSQSKSDVDAKTSSEAVESGIPDLESEKHLRLDSETLECYRHMLGVCKTQMSKKKPIDGQPVFSVPHARSKVFMGFPADMVMRVIMHLIAYVVGDTICYPAVPGGSLSQVGGFLFDEKPEAILSTGDDISLRIGHDVYDIDESSKDTNYSPFLLGVVSGVVGLFSQKLADFFYDQMCDDIYLGGTVRILSTGAKAISRFTWLSGLPPTLDVNSVSSSLIVLACARLVDCHVTEATLCCSFTVNGTTQSFAMKPREELPVCVEGKTEYLPFALEIVKAAGIKHKCISRPNSDFSIFCHHVIKTGVAVYDVVRCAVKVCETLVPARRFPTFVLVDVEKVTEFHTSVVARLRTVCDYLPAEELIKEYGYEGIDIDADFVITCFKFLAILAGMNPHQIIALLKKNVRAQHLLGCEELFHV